MSLKSWWPPKNYSVISHTGSHQLSLLDTKYYTVKSAVCIGDDVVRRSHDIRGLKLTKISRMI